MFSYRQWKGLAKSSSVPLPQTGTAGITTSPATTLKTTAAHTVTQIRITLGVMVDWATRVAWNATVAPWSRSTAAGAAAQTDHQVQIGSTGGMGAGNEALTAVSARSHATMGSKAVAPGLVTEVGAVPCQAMTRRDMTQTSWGVTAEIGCRKTRHHLVRGVGEMEAPRSHWSHPSMSCLWKTGPMRVRLYTKMLRRSSPGFQLISWEGVFSGLWWQFGVWYLSALTASSSTLLVGSGVFKQGECWAM